MLGDVFYSVEAMQQIASFPGEIGFFGREKPSPITLSPCGELFSLSFQSSYRRKLLTILETAIGEATQGHWGKLWDVYRIVSGLDGADFQDVVKKTESKYFNRVFDLTDDIDTVQEFRTLKAIHDFWQQWEINSLSDIARRDDSLSAYFDFGKTLFEKRQYEQALAVFETILRYRPSHSACRSIVGLGKNSAEKTDGENPNFAPYKPKDSERNPVISLALNYLTELGPRTLSLWLRWFHMHAQAGDRTAGRCGFLLGELIAGRAVNDTDLVSLVLVLRTNSIDFT